MGACGTTEAAAPPVASVTRICAADCAGPMARMSLWRDAGGAVALYVYDGDFDRCSHPPRIWFDKDGKELARVGSNPVPAGGVAEGPPIQARLTAGLHESETIFCPR